jgi:hypothetical protein
MSITISKGNPADVPMTPHAWQVFSVRRAGILPAFLTCSRNAALILAGNTRSLHFNSNSRVRHIFSGVT